MTGFISLSTERQTGFTTLSREVILTILSNVFINSENSHTKFTSNLSVKIR